MTKKSVVIGLANGLEATPIALLVQTATKFSSSIYLTTENKRVNAKSIMGLMSLGLLNGDSIMVEVDGEDEENAIAEIERFISGK
ncbi:MAG: HPr family phosphocarrier protein [Lachnospiraceae bacterium]|uniref:HPr family phosphocarrier protein n=1 Tax=Roseburia hominis TaxID=301301 RepID=UPI001F33E273|nr:HPr family phosphocarrier protein [Roseburia hominis]MCI5713755.1 HPr family phosphocarrier protein [Lachnospiraceae bacterium]MDD6169714.1 HPr family phosphocarrier protein [Lachnospiraceae bacterium]MDY4840107.1 HPr family phosphocarrier protein [Lachnospiraceae bacterium]